MYKEKTGWKETRKQKNHEITSYFVLGYNASFREANTVRLFALRNFMGILSMTNINNICVYTVGCDIIL